MSKNMLKIVFIATIILLLIITICGLFSFNTSNSYEIVNQYGEIIKMFGAGIYAHDSYFKAPIFIGSDFTMLVFILPLFIIFFLKLRKEKSIENHIDCFAILALILYYAASISFGVTYNSLQLLYIGLFGISFYGVCFLLAKLISISTSHHFTFEYSITKGMLAFLIVTGICLFVAWLPDIISSLISSKPLDLIEVYTTDITYVLDMGIISPLMFLIFYLIKKRLFIGYVFFRMVLKVCMGIGIMLPIQTVFQIMAGIQIPFPALITKVFTFVLLALFAALYERRIKSSVVANVSV